ncbi:MAG TPA: serine/threonine-protein kinase [Nannocystaceae bacterium]|nr:serine/threonine-protein kinase [Nannocystaceae bacterium]
MDDRRTLAGVGPSGARTPIASLDDATATGIRGPQSASDPATRGRRPTGIVVGELLADRYRIVRPLGAGGMGEVWEAVHVVIGRAVAVKVLVPDLRPESTRAERMMREAKLVAKIEHPHVVEIIDFGHTGNGTPFIAMELLRGRSLFAVLRDEGPMQWQRVATLGQQLARALAAAHDVGVIHRDLKPANVFVSTSRDGIESCKLIDFGIAKAVELSDEERTLTKTGIVFGTPAYMSPEQARGEPLDGRSDMFALGMILSELLTGERPFHATTPAEMLYLKLFTPPALPSRRAPGRGIPAALDAIVRRCLSKDREARFADLRALADALGAALRGDAIAMPTEEVIPVPGDDLRSRYREVVRKTQLAMARPIVVASRSSGAQRNVTGTRIAGVIAGVGVGAIVSSGAWWWMRERVATPEPIAAEAPADPPAPVSAPLPVAAPAPAPLPAPAAAPVPVAAPVAAPVEAVKSRPSKRRVVVEPPPVATPSTTPSEPAPTAPSTKVPDGDGIFR